MTLMNWDPWRDIADLRTIYNRMFGDGLTRASGEGQLAPASWYMPVDVTETAEEFTIRAEMPGMKAEDIDITVADNQVTIKGQRADTSEEKGVNFIRSERRFGSFSRSFSLGTPVDSGNVEASYREGVLEVHLPKVQSALPRQIKVKTDSQPIQ